MELDSERDLFLLNVGNITGQNLTKICDENIYVDNNGVPLKNIQWFYFQLVRIVGLLIDNRIQDKDKDIDFIKGPDDKPIYDENDNYIIKNTKTGIILDKISLRDYIINYDGDPKKESPKLKNDFKNYGLVPVSKYKLGFIPYILELNKTMDDVIGFKGIEEEIEKIILMDILQYLTENLSKYNDIEGKLDDKNNIYKKLYITLCILLGLELETIPEGINIETISDLLKKEGFESFEQEKEKKEESQTVSSRPTFIRQQSSSSDFQENERTIFFIKLDEKGEKLEKLYIKLGHNNMGEIFNNINCKIVNRGYLTIGLNFDKIQIEDIRVRETGSYGYIFQK